MKRKANPNPQQGNDVKRSKKRAEEEESDNIYDEDELDAKEETEKSEPKLPKEGEGMEGDEAEDLIDEKSKERQSKGLLKDEDDVDEADPEEGFTETGFRIEPFNMKREMEQGYFDEFGTYHEKRNEDDVTDPWLEEVDAGRISFKSKELKSVQVTEAARTKKEEADKTPAVSARDLPSIKASLCCLLQSGETPSQALRRLGAEAKKPRQQKPKSKKTSQEEDAMSTEAPEAKKEAEDAEVVDEQELTRRQHFNLVTEMCDKLVQLGDYNCYSQTKEQLQASLGLTPSPSSASGVFWQYKWYAEEGAETYGPFSSKDILDWIKQGHISAERPVYVRQVTQSNEPQEEVWHPYDSIDFDLYA
eukprot:GILI01027987.1.p1 GENE.GILI01027987.1~~GILI01027987.1.p1  ORF type:complete len:361 (-),score=85.00 GILI01027987.1:56-1138(-)